MPVPDASTTFAWLRTMDKGSFEHATVRPLADGWHLQGTVLAVHEGEPLRLDYALQLDAQWRSLELSVQQTWRGQHTRLVLARDDDDTWQQDGQPAPHLAGCQDVDLGLSPLTNTPPIRRLMLEGRDEGEFAMAWVRFPGPTVERAPQRYRRLGESRWRYEGVGTGFTATLDVDAAGFVVTYGDIWARAGITV